jgi:hypothetical protein
MAQASCTWLVLFIIRPMIRFRRKPCRLRVGDQSHFQQKWVNGTTVRRPTTTLVELVPNHFFTSSETRCASIDRLRFPVRPPRFYIFNTGSIDCMNLYF